jgi:acetoin utilization protein AcuA
MSDPLSTDILQPTHRGEVRIRIAPSATEIRSYQFDPQFGTHAHYRSLYTRRKSLEEQVGVPGTRVALALADDTHIIGFGVLADPDTDDRWSRLGPGLMTEVKVIEICRDWRSAGIAGGILEKILAAPDLEGKIVYMVGYSWTWDLDGTAMTAQQYRMILIRLFGGFGFKEFQTNEPNICLKPENLFMARVGEKVPAEVRTNFKWLLFDAYP